MNRPGFTLIELLVATFIAGLLSVLLFAAVYQINRFVPVIDSMTDLYERAALVNAQLERDLSGVTVPNEYYARMPKKEAVKKEGEQKKAANEKTKKADETLRQAQGERGGQNEEKSEDNQPKKPLEKVFYGINKDGIFDQLSFITTNPLQVYWSTKAGSAKPRVARVLYKLKQEPKPKTGPQLYSLIREETGNLEYDALGKEHAKEYVLAQGISGMTVEYTAVLPEEKKDEKMASEKQGTLRQAQGEREIKKTRDWLGKSPQEAPQPEAPKEKAPLAPQLIEFTVNFWDAHKKRAVPFTFKIRIRSEIDEKRADESPRLLEKLKDLVGQVFPPQAPNTVVVQGQKPVPRGFRR